jgi:iron donor protein CyaY
LEKILGMLDAQEFQLKSDEALGKLYRSLAKASDEHGFDTDLSGALTVEFDDPPAKFVVSPNAPVRQVWVSAHMKSYKLDWDAARGEFVLPESGQSLRELVKSAVSQQLGEEIQL